jgi:hypothetical protein
MRCSGVILIGCPLFLLRGEACLMPGSRLLVCRILRDMPVLTSHERRPPVLHVGVHLPPRWDVLDERSPIRWRTALFVHLLPTCVPASASVLSTRLHSDQGALRSRAGQESEASSAIRCPSVIAKWGLSRETTAGINTKAPTT